MCQARWQDEQAQEEPLKLAKPKQASTVPIGVRPETKLVPLGDLHPAPWNPRSIKEERFLNLCDSLATDPDFLWSRPILALPDGSIFGGNMRYRAAEHIGMTAVPAIIEDIPAHLAKERALRDNANWGEWQEDELTALMQELKQAGSNVDLLGFDGDEIERLMADTLIQFPVVNPPSQAQIDAEAARLAGQYNKPDDLIPLVCPGCFLEFSVARKELLHEDFGQELDS